MKRSLYTKCVANYPRKGQHLLFNTLTHSIITVDDELKGYIDNPDEYRGEVPAPYREELQDRFMIVPDSAADTSLIEDYFKEIKSITEKSLEVTLLTTFACNFACTYCVEDGVICNIRMNEETTAKCASYIIDQAGKNNVETINLYFYGGEPLMNIPPIRSIAKAVRKHCEKKGLEFGFALTTNGALLKPSLVRELKKLGLEGVKVTIDGDRAHHNAKRPYKNGEGSFDDIIENIRYAAKHIAVDVGGNFDDTNVDSFESLILYLRDIGLHRTLNKVSFKPISETPEDRKKAPLSAELACAYSREGTGEAMVKLRKLLIDNRFKTDDSIGVNVCGITLDGLQITIDPVGKLYKCMAFVGREEFCVGTIETGDSGEVKKDLWRRCTSCENVALCGDGCIYGSYIKYGDTDRLNCQKDYMDYLVTENLKLEYGRSKGAAL
ncbi:MAG: radical SAM protein [Spirochaetales bacterium]|nr:radical SAM protein [Spirochaetales bacterium]